MAALILISTFDHTGKLVRWGIKKPVGEDKNGTILIAKDSLPLRKTVNIFHSSPGITPMAPLIRAAGKFAAFDINQQFMTVIGINDKIETFDSQTGKDCPL